MHAGQHADQMVTHAPADAHDDIAPLDVVRNSHSNA
jgi:hypothetical protein